MSGTCWAMKSSPRPLAFPPQPPPSLATRPCSVGSSVLCQGPTPPQCSRSACGAWPSRAVLNFGSVRHCGGLPVLVHVVSQRAWGLRLRGVTSETRVQAPLGVLAFPCVHRVGTPKFQFSKLNALPADASVYASTVASRQPPQNSRSGWFATPFL